MSVVYEVEPTVENYWRAIILFGLNAASYKFALAKAIYEFKDSPTDLISLEHLAEPFSRHLCEHLQHSPKQATSSSSRFIDACNQHNNVSSYTQPNAWGIFAGVTEHSRACMTFCKYGNMFRGMHRILTDFPMAPTHPYDAGIARFCKDCVTCADSCPWESMPTGDASWEHEDPEEETLLNYTPGYKGWRLYNLKCIRCKNCHTVCPFNSYDDAMIHELVRATAAITPIFNGFMANMHTTFGYGTKNPVDFWESDSMPMGRFDADWVKA